MRTKVLTIAAAASALAIAAGPALTADLDYGTKDTPYDDPRYSDIYRHPAPPPPRYAAPYPPPPVYREQRYTGPQPPPPHYVPDQRPRYEGRYHDECLPQQTIRARLEHRGWFDFHDPKAAGNLVHIRARRSNGQLYDLTVDRCSGQVLGAELIDSRSAYAPPPPPPQDWRNRSGPYRGY